MSTIVKVKSVEHLTHDVIHLTLEKPEGLVYTPGQAVDISINKPCWEDKKTCFTFVSLPEENQIEFVIKTYPSHQGITNELLSVKPGDEISVYKPFGDIHFKGEGIFIAGGAGITPFLAILKDLKKQNNLGKNKLIFANRSKADIIMENHFNDLLGEKFINILSDEELEGYEHGYVSQELIQKHQEPTLKFYYLCGPPPMMNAVEKHLAALGIPAEYIVKEGF
ncbi:MAG: flavodoxin reductase [Bacteroidetes bacterium]|nr:flavodoxin reductase [Bacteroidota bacterium]